MFAAAPAPEDLAGRALEEIDRLIADASFHRPKAAQIRDIARITVDRYAGKLPCDATILRAFRGVGPKCAHLALGIACGQARISVDVHVHRVTNRWGYVRTRQPEHTMAELERRLPRPYRVELNGLLVPFGKHVCTGRCRTAPPAPYLICVVRLE